VLELLGELLENVIGNDDQDLAGETKPKRSSIAAAAITVVFPAPTSWNRPTARSWRMRQTAAFLMRSRREGGVRTRERQVRAVVFARTDRVECVIVEARKPLGAIDVAP